MWNMFTYNICILKCVHYSLVMHTFKCLNTDKICMNGRLFSFMFRVKVNHDLRILWHNNKLSWDMNENSLILYTSHILHLFAVIEILYLLPQQLMIFYRVVFSEIINIVIWSLAPIYTQLLFGLTITKLVVLHILWFWPLLMNIVIYEARYGWVISFYWY